jgi:hypothetical protein
MNELQKETLDRLNENAKSFKLRSRKFSDTQSICSNLIHGKISSFTDKKFTETFQKETLNASQRENFKRYLESLEHDVVNEMRVAEQAKLINDKFD